jgi:hypothetical protein
MRKVHSSFEKTVSEHMPCDSEPLTGLDVYLLADTDMLPAELVN